jgi:hypothetical protein
MTEDPVDRAKENPLTYAIIFLLSLVNGIVTAAIAFFQDSWNMRGWLTAIAVASTVAVVIFIVVLRLSHLTPKMNEKIHRYCWLLLIIPVVIFSLSFVPAEQSGLITAIDDASVDDLKCSFSDLPPSTVPKLTLEGDLQAKERLCLPHAPNSAGGDTRRRLLGKADHVPGHIWLEVFIPSQNLGERPIQGNREWYYTPVFQYGESWESYATLGIPTDTTAKIYALRLITCNDAANRRILEQAFLPQQNQASGPVPATRYQYRWGDECDHDALEDWGVHVDGP